MSMDLITWYTIVGFNLTFDILAIYFRASLLSTVAGIEALSGLSYLVNAGGIVIHTAYSGGFTTQNASANDYILYVTVLILLTVTSFLLTLGIFRRSRPTD